MHLHFELSGGFGGLASASSVDCSTLHESKLKTTLDSVYEDADVDSRCQASLPTFHSGVRCSHKLYLSIALADSTHNEVRPPDSRNLGVFNA